MALFLEAFFKNWHTVLSLDSPKKDLILIKLPLVKLQSVKLHYVIHALSFYHTQECF